MIKSNPSSFVLKKGSSTLRLGEIFCGPGGLALGALKAGFKNKRVCLSIEHAWASDWDKDACDTYRLNICPLRPQSVICENVRELNIRRLGPIDIFAYGFPCNDFSIVGKHRGISGSFGALYSYGIKVINRLRPIVIVAENVGGITSANKGRAFRTIIDELSNAGDGYEISCHKYRFEDYGVPQARHRIVIVGFARSSGLFFKIPAPTHLQCKVSAKLALEEPPIPVDVKNHELTRQSARVIERLANTRPGENAWSESIPKSLQLNVKATRLSQIYRRLHPDKPAYTITGSGGGGTHVYHWHEPRALTNRERARLQTFPDTFHFCGSKEQVRKQIGMAVPPYMASILFNSILKTLAGETYDSCDSNIPL